MSQTNQPTQATLLISNKSEMGEIQVIIDGVVVFEDWHWASEVNVPESLEHLETQLKRLLSHLNVEIDVVYK